MRILVFGDSIAQGYWADNGGWVELLKMHYWESYFSGKNLDPATVFNLSISGNNSVGILERFYQESMVRQHKETILIFATGVNDARLFDGKPEQSASDYAETLEQILIKAKQLTDKILFVGCTNVDDTLSMAGNPAWGNGAWNNQRVWEFEQSLRDFCSLHKVPLVRLFEAYEVGKDLLADGLHPNSQGQKVIYDLVVPYVDAMLEAS